MENNKIQSDVTDQNVTAIEGVPRAEIGETLPPPGNESIGLSFAAQESEIATANAQLEETSDQYVALDEDVSWGKMTGTFTQLDYEPMGLTFGEAQHENVAAAQTNSASFDEQLMTALLKVAKEKEGETTDQNITADQDAPTDERRARLPRKPHGVANLASLLPSDVAIGQDVTASTRRGLSKIGRVQANLASFGFPQNQGEIIDQPPSILGEGTIRQSASASRSAIADRASSVLPTILEEETTDRGVSTDQSTKAAQKKRRFLRLRRGRRNSAASVPSDLRESLSSAYLQSLGVASAQRTTAVQPAISNQGEAERQNVTGSQGRNTNRKKKKSPRKPAGL